MDDLREDINAAIQEAPATETPTAPDPTSAPEPASRDASGRFAPRTPAQQPTPAPATSYDAPTTVEQPVEQPAQQPSPAPTAIRPPVSWKPEEREGWERLDPKHQQAVLRREREIDNALRETANARRFASELQQVIAPYVPLIQAENSTPTRTVESLLRTAATLRTASPVQKANLVAEMIDQFGIPVEALDQAIVARRQGRPAAQDPTAPVMQAIEQKLKPIEQFMNSLQQRRQAIVQQSQQQAQAELVEFLNDPQNEFARDVAGDMADILDLAANRGQQMTLQEAYRRATMLHPTISKIVESRGVGAAQQTAAAQKARNAAVSVPGVGAPTVSSDDGSEGDDIRSAITASVRQLANRR